MAQRAIRALRPVRGSAGALGNELRGLGHEAQGAGREMAAQPWVERLARLGYLVRGLLYLLVGLLAVQLAQGAQDLSVDHQGAIRAIAERPQGSALLVVTALGLAGYAVWGLIRAVFDPLRKGSDAKGLAQRFGYVVSGATHAALCVVAVRYLLGAASSGETNAAESWTAWLLARPFGPVLVG